ncbi:hypothetical protein [Parabacteroides bouchesdurhonensis]|uniref:hypothetical protein n=1 Tax=Parabacteroides bouchesdurhonensis TaxID=1936995 RepID=UPI000C850109|nr:hypothetical protein [Parabacteroides bouchesdurhonensis]RHJ95217.1 hypothetical protein DW095_02010 [Bacteroides sp. AM07-16]
MKKSFVSLLTVAAFLFGMASCNSSAKKAEAEAKTEQDAVIAGEVSKSLLTEELKVEVTQFLKDMPESDLAYKLATGEVEVSVANTDFMLPVSKISELTTQAQKARACGMYFADLNILKAMKKPTTDVENALVKLTTDLNIPFVIDIMKESAPAGASKEEVNAFMKAQEDKLIDAMMENDKADIEIELLGGMSVEYAYLLANPGLVVKGDAITAGLSDNMVKRLDTLQQVVADLAKYYPDLTQLGETIAPLKDMVVSVNAARAAQKDIEAMRANLLK